MKLFKAGIMKRYKVVVQTSGEDTLFEVTANSSLVPYRMAKVLFPDLPDDSISVTDVTHSVRIRHRGGRLEAVLKAK